MKTQINKNITLREVNFAKWYTDVIRQAELCDYGADSGSAGGTIIFRPRGYAIWEHIQTFLNREFRTLKIQNVMFPLLITQKSFQIEKDHIEGFAPECAMVTKVGTEQLEEPLIIRPTSEVLFCQHFARILSGYKQLPILYNQWCNVIRWEKTTRPFLRTSEFLWQEGHTVHSNSSEAKALTLTIIKLYAKFVEEQLNIKVIVGKKTAHERFAGAQETYTIETMMQDGQALQAGTSHYFGQEFAKVFNIKFNNKENNEEFGFQTSWGVSTRLIGALIMAHSDDLGLVLPVIVAPEQIMILNLKPLDEEVQKVVNKLQVALQNSFRVTVTAVEKKKSASFKKSEAQVKGIPLLIEIGQQELTNQKIKIVLRHNLKEYFIDFNDEKILVAKITDLLKTISIDLFNLSKTKFTEKLKEITDFNEYQKLVKTHKGYFITPFCGDITCEQAIKTQTSTTSRCVPLEKFKENSTCFKCKKVNSPWTYFARSY